MKTSVELAWGGNSSSSSNSGSNSLFPLSRLCALPLVSPLPRSNRLSVSGRWWRFRRRSKERRRRRREGGGTSFRQLSGRRSWKGDGLAHDWQKNTCTFSLKKIANRQTHVHRELLSSTLSAGSALGIYVARKKRGRGGDNAALLEWKGPPLSSSCSFFAHA